MPVSVCPSTGGLFPLLAPTVRNRGQKSPAVVVGLPRPLVMEQSEANGTEGTMARFWLLMMLIVLGCGRMPRSSAMSDSAKDEEPSAESGDDEASTNRDSEDSEDSGDSESGAVTSTSVNKPPADGPSCLNAQGNVQECMDDRDCCKDFYCGIDPDGSTRIKVCLYGGNK